MNWVFILKVFFPNLIFCKHWVGSGLFAEAAGWPFVSLISYCFPLIRLFSLLCHHGSQYLKTYNLINVNYYFFHLKQHRTGSSLLITIAAASQTEGDRFDPKSVTIRICSWWFHSIVPKTKRQNAYGVEMKKNLWNFLDSTNFCKLTIAADIMETLLGNLLVFESSESFCCLRNSSKFRRYEKILPSVPQLYR